MSVTKNTTTIIKSVIVDIRNSFLYWVYWYLILTKHINAEIRIDKETIAALKFLVVIIIEGVEEIVIPFEKFSKEIRKNPPKNLGSILIILFAIGVSKYIGIIKAVTFKIYGIWSACHFLYIGLCWWLVLILTWLHKLLKLVWKLNEIKLSLLILKLKL